MVEPRMPDDTTMRGRLEVIERALLSVIRDWDYVGKAELERAHRHVEIMLERSDPCGPSDAKYGPYTQGDLDSMRCECSGHEYDTLTESGDLSNVLYEGCIGWRHIPVADVVYYWEDHVYPSEIRRVFRKEENGTPNES